MALAARSTARSRFDLRTHERQGSDTLRGIEEADGSTGAYTMIGDAKDNVFFGLFGGKDRVELGAATTSSTPAPGRTT